VFALGLTLGAGGLIATATALTTAIASVHRASTGSYEVLLAGLRFTYPTVNGSGALLLAIAALGAAAVTIAARASWRQRRRYRGFIGHLGPLEPLEKDPRVKVIADPRPQAFCAGLLHPTVYVSQRTIELLTDTELEAVLAHEHHHRLVRDPLRFACGRILSEALFFVPVLRPLCDRYSDLAEVSADRAAVRASAGRQAPLASALLLFDESGPPRGHRNLTRARRLAAGAAGQMATAAIAAGCVDWRPVSDQRDCLGHERGRVCTRDLQPADPLLSTVRGDDDDPPVHGLSQDAYQDGGEEEPRRSAALSTATPSSPTDVTRA
jgi:hypothetical protein